MRKTGGFLIRLLVQALAAISLFSMLFMGLGSIARADSVGQAQVTKYFAPETVKMLMDRTGTGTPGIQPGDIISYIIESVPINDGGSQGVNGYITDYIPYGLQVVGASFVAEVPDPNLPGGFAYTPIPMRDAGLMLDGLGSRGANFVGVPPFADGALPQGSQDTGIFYSTDLRTAKLPITTFDVKPTTGAKFAAAFPVFNNWDYAQFVAFGSKKSSLGASLGTNKPGGGVQPIIATGVGAFAGLASPVAGPQTYYTNDYNPGLLVLTQASQNAPPAYVNANFMNVGPWQRIAYPGSSMGGSGPVTVGLAGTGQSVSTAVPTSLGHYLNEFNGLPYLAVTVPTVGNTNAVRWAFGQRVVGALERVKITFKVRDFGNFAALGVDFQNHSSVFGGDTSAPAAGKDLSYKYLGPTQSISDARIMVVKKPIAVSAIAAPYAWRPLVGTSVVPGDFIKYSILYLNATATTLTGFSLSDTMDANLTYIAGSATTGVPYLALPTGAAGAGAIVTWAPVAASPASVLSPGEGGTVELVAQVTGGAGVVATNTANGVATTPAVSAFSYSPLSVFNIRPGNVTQSKTVTPSTALPNGQVKYSIVVNSVGGGLQAVAGDMPGVPAGSALVIGDILDANLSYTSTASISLRDRATGNIYPYALAGANVTSPVAPIAAATPAYWQVFGYPATYPAPVPVAGAVDFLTNVDFLIDFYANVTAAAAPGTYFNALATYVGDPANGDSAFTASGLAPVTVTGSTTYPQLTFNKATQDLNGGALNPADTLRYNLTLSNAVTSPATATTPVITDAVPAGIPFKVGSATATAGATISYSNNGGVSYLYTPVGVTDVAVTHIRFSFVNLLAGATVTAAFDVVLPTYLSDGQVIRNQASLSALSGVNPFTILSDDPNTTTVADATKMTVAAPADFSTSSKTATGNTGGGSNVRAGDVLTYTIVVNNSGFAASNVKVSDSLDLNTLTFGAMGALPTNWSVAGPDANGVITWSSASFVAGATATLTFTATVKAIANGAKVNNAVSMVSDQSATLIINAPTLTVPAPQVSGLVFNDLDGDGLFNGVDTRIANVTVALRNIGSTVDVISTATNALGEYVLVSPNVGDMYVQVTDLTGILSGFNSTSANPITVTMVDGLTVANQNFGYKLASLPAVVKGRIFADADGNGLQNGAETGWANVTLSLLTASDVLIASTTTDVNGDYAFNSIAQGNYKLLVTDTAGLLNNQYLTTGLSSPVLLNNLLANSTSQVNFGYNLGSLISGVIFDDLNNNGVLDVAEIGLPKVSLTLSQAGATVASTTSNNLGEYQFQAIPPSGATAYTLTVTTPTGFVLTSTPVSPKALTITQGVNATGHNFGYYAIPVLSVSKTASASIVSTNSSVAYTIRVTNTGGSAANFVLRDILPTSTPPALPYTASPSDFKYLVTSNVTLNGVAFTIPTTPTIYATQPTWSGFTMPGSSVLEVTFTAFTGALDGQHLNGVQLSYNNTGLAQVSNFAGLAPVTITASSLFGKVAHAVNGVAVATNVAPTVKAGDTVSYTITLANSSAALIQSVTEFTETMPAGFSYVANSAVLTAPTNPIVGAINPVIAGQTLTWTLAAPAPATLATSTSLITLKFDLLVGATAVSGSHTDVAGSLVSVNAGAALRLSTGNTAPVVVSQPILSMSKATSTAVVSADNTGAFAPASYIVTVTNTGQVAASSVVLTDTLPVGFTFSSGSATINGANEPNITFSQAAGSQILTISTTGTGFAVPASNGVTAGKLVVSYNVTIAAGTAAGTLRNTVALSSANGGTLTGVGADVVLSGIQLQKSTSTATVNKGGTATYTITIANNVATAVNNVSLSDILPTGFTYRAGSTLINGVASADPVGTSQTPQWSLASVAGNSTSTITFGANVSATMNAGTYYNTIQAIAAGVTFPNPGPTAPVLVQQAQPLLLITKTADVATAAPAGNVLYTVKVQNTGAGTATVVTLDDTLSGYTSFALNPFATGIPFRFTDGANASGFTAGAMTIRYAVNGAAFATYTPVDDGTGHDPAITAFKIDLVGSMNANVLANPSFTIEYQVQVK